MQNTEREKLHIGTVLELVSLNSNGREFFKITEIVGEGATCIVYSAEDINNNNNRVRIKEYYPIEVMIKRAKDGSLVIEDSYSFEKGISRFTESYERQISLRRINAMTNTISNVHGIYSCNNTIYTVMTYNVGWPYNKYTDPSLHSMLKITRAVAKVVGEYHKLGLLHLDIKPSNIYVMPETDDSIIMFDFDSMVLKDDLLSGKIKLYSYSKSWAAPEQTSGKVSRISERTDIYSIGALLFIRIFGRDISFVERMKNARYDFISESGLLENVPPEALRMLTEFFHRTLSSNPDERYHSSDEVVTALDKLIKVTDNDYPYIVNKSLPINDSFTGRAKELEIINEHFERNDLVFIKGINGIGKTELAMQYAYHFKNCYDTVIFAVFSVNLKQTLADDDNLKIVNLFRAEMEDDDSFFERKLEMAAQLCNQHTLMIIDGFDVRDDDLLNRILTFNCKKIFTTQFDFSDRFFQLNLGAVDFEYICNMYKEQGISLENPSEKDALYKIYDTFEGNTLVMEFALKQIRENYSDVKTLGKIIENTAVSKTISEKAESLFSSCFKTDSLSKSETYAIQLLSNSGDVGMQGDVLCEAAGFSDYSVLSELERKGYIKYHFESGRFSVHSMLRKIVKSFLSADVDGKALQGSCFYDVGVILDNVDKPHLMAVLGNSRVNIIANYNPRVTLFTDGCTFCNFELLEKEFTAFESDEYPFLLYDDSVYMNQKLGVMFTNKYIHVNALMHKSTRIPYGAVDKMYIIGKDLGFVLKNGKKLSVLISDGDKHKLLSNIIDALFSDIVKAFPEKLMNTQKSVENVNGNTYKIKPFISMGYVPKDKVGELTEHLRKRIEKGFSGRQKGFFTQNSRIYVNGCAPFDRIVYDNFRLDSDEVPIVLVNESPNDNRIRGFLLTDKRLHRYYDKLSVINYRDIDYIICDQMPFYKYHCVRLELKNNKDLTILVSSYNPSNSLYVFEVMTEFFEKANDFLSQ